MNNADALVEFLAKQGMVQYFMLCGGGAMILNDAVAKHPKATATFMHHEQSCAMAAVAYTRQTGIPAAVMVTTGCGVTNALTGLLDAWQDSVPVVFISGGVARQYTTYENNSRHFGVQEANCRDIVTPYTKGYYNTFCGEQSQDFEVIYKTMMEGRKGPVWIEMFLDEQGSSASTRNTYTKTISASQLRDFQTSIRGRTFNKFKYERHLQKRLKKSRRPLLLLGNGIRQADCLEEVNELISKHNLPFITTYGATDLATKENQKKHVGVVGIKGSRAGNFAMQNCDLLLVLGSSLSTPVVGYDITTWAREADIVIVDIDDKEHEKYEHMDHMIIKTDLKDFFKDIEQYGVTFCNPLEWRKQCKDWKNKWGLHAEVRRSENGLDFYKAMDMLNWKIRSNVENKLYGSFTVIGDAGSAYYVSSQTFDAPGCRLITPLAQAEMGATIPYSIGAAISGQKVIGVTGDGSFMTNIQELQVIEQLQLPVLLFVWNNQGYLSIRNTQENFFDGRYFGTDEKSGLKISNIEKMSNAFGIKYFKIGKDANYSRFASIVDDFVINEYKPMIIEVECAPIQDVFPTVGAEEKNGKLISRPLENMKPFLSEEELKKEMLVKIIE